MSVARLSAWPDTRFGAVAAALFVLGVGIAGLTAWALGDPLQLSASSGAMMPHTAAACLSLGFGLLMAARGSVTAAAASAVLAVVVAMGSLFARALGLPDLPGRFFAAMLGRELPAGWHLATTTTYALCVSGAALWLASTARARRLRLFAAGLFGLGAALLGVAEAVVALSSSSLVDLWWFGESMALPTALTLAVLGTGLVLLTLSRQLARDAPQLGVPLIVAGTVMSGTFALAAAVALGEISTVRHAAQREAQRMADLVALDVRLGLIDARESGAASATHLRAWLDPRAPRDYVVSLLRDGRVVALGTRAEGAALGTLESLEVPGIAAQARVAGQPWTVRAAPVRALVDERSSRLPLIVMPLGLAVAVASALGVAAWRAARRRMKSERAAHAARVESEARWRAVNESSPVGIYFATTAGEIQFLNPACRAIFGLDAAQATGFGWTDVIHSDDRARVFAELEKSRLEARDFASEYRIVRGGVIAWISVRATSARDGHRALGIVGTVEDVTERRRAEDQNRLRLRELETLLNVSAHDLQEPLRAMSGLASALREDFAAGLGEEGQDLLDRLARGARRMSDLVEAVGQVARVQAMDVGGEIVDAAETVEASLDELASEIRRTGARVTVVGPFPRLRGNAAAMRTALTHVVANALKFVPPGAAPDVEIAAFAPPALEEAGFIVRDRGPGVPADQQEFIFRLFRRGVGRDVEGLGVGLAIARAVAERHGGRAFVRPRADGGSEFALTFGAGLTRPADERTATAAASEP
jgi:PAS domain S-box-containing protein